MNKDVLITGRTIMKICAHAGQPTKNVSSKKVEWKHEHGKCIYARKVSAITVIFDTGLTVARLIWVGWR